MGGGGAGEVEVVAAHSNADPVHFIFSRSDGGDHSGVGSFASLRDSLFSINNTVLVPVGMRVPTPWSRSPKSFARALIQVSLLGPRMRCQYSSAWPLVGLMTTLACSS